MERTDNQAGAGASLPTINRKEMYISYGTAHETSDYRARSQPTKRRSRLHRQMNLLYNIAAAYKNEAAADQKQMKEAEYKTD